MKDLEIMGQEVWVKGIRKVYSGEENMKENRSAFKYLKAEEGLKIWPVS